ncbi:TLD-domain-containing protein [Coprinopsis marcescibilis]|uniref:Oxidation resistance protein 1 n=1 Tax=Coprinopsis marcescibilis TaxID=230819 RepID=A0A5C3KUB2_COPMA|nr:TLD-domain-containing protein [Coprinopsis marcescibilis]
MPRLVGLTHTRVKSGREDGVGVKGKGVEEHLGMIDEDYFVGREPAESVAIVGGGGSSVGSDASGSVRDDLGVGGGTAGAAADPSRSPTWSFKSLFSSPTSSRAHTRASSLQAANFGQGGGSSGVANARPLVGNTASSSNLSTTTANLSRRPSARRVRRQTSSPVAPGSPVQGLVLPVPPVVSGGDDEFAGGADRESGAAGGGRARRGEVQEEEHDDGTWSGSRTRRSSGYSTLGSWVGSFLWAGSGDADGDDRGRRERSSSQEEGGRKVLTESPSPVSSSAGRTLGVHGKSGRPLPRARPSLESIQQVYAAHPHYEPQEVRITHGTPFMPVGGSHSSFSQISGAPGFKPEEYGWDKGFSEELERELRGDPAESTPVEEEEEDDEDCFVLDSGGFSFGFGRERGRDRSDDQSALIARMTNQHQAQAAHRTPLVPPPPPLLAHTTRHTSRSPMRNVGELIEKKMASVVLAARKSSTEPVLTAQVADLIRTHLPPLARLPKTWSLLYSLDQHGISLNTLYANCEAPERNRKLGAGFVGQGGVVLVVRDSEGEGGMFGVYVPEGIGRRRKGFFGGGDSFLWKYTDGGELRVFKATGRNPYFAICEGDYVAFGGGSSAYGLYLDSSLLEGSSARCLTFGNGVLCGHTASIGGSSSVSGDTNGGANGGTAERGRERTVVDGKPVDFECVGLEVWGVGPS